MPNPSYNSLKRSFSGLHQPHKKPRPDFLTSLDVIEPEVNNLVVSGQFTPFSAKTPTSLTAPKSPKTKFLPPKAALPTPASTPSKPHVRSPGPSRSTKSSAVETFADPKRTDSPTSTASSATSTWSKASKFSYASSTTLLLSTNVARPSLQSLSSFNKRLFKKSSLPNFKRAASGFSSKIKHFSDDMSSYKYKIRQLVRDRINHKKGSTTGKEVTGSDPTTCTIDLDATPSVLNDLEGHKPEEDDPEEDDGDSVAAALMYFLYNETGTIDIDDIESLISKLNVYD